MNQPEILVVGSGVMGRGIAKGFAAAGISCAIYSRNAAKVSGVDPRVAVLDQLPPRAPLLVIESVPEEKEPKFACYAAIEAAYAGAPVLASNTSGSTWRRWRSRSNTPNAFSASITSCPRT